MSLVQLLAQAAGGPNWVLIIGIVVVFVVVAIVLLIPSKQAKLDADAKKALKDESGEKKALPEGDDKDQKSLAEIKESKRANVSDSKSKDELRELRKERRAATQTEKAIQEREEKEADDDAESSASDDIDAAEALKKAEQAEADAKADAEAELEKMTAPIDDIITKSDADVGDVLASLFGNNEKSTGFSDLNFDDVIGQEIKTEGTAFPTLGSALISLTELTAAAEADDNSKANEVSPLDEISKKLAEKAEKKTA